MLRDAYISAPVLTGNDSGFYHLLGWSAIAVGILSLFLVALLLTPKNRRAIAQAGQDQPDASFLQLWEQRKPGDPFDKAWQEQQAAFTQQVMRAEPDTLTDTLIPGVTAVPLPPDTGRPTVTVKPIVGVVVEEVPDDEPQDEGDRILEEIRESNRQFLASWSA